MVSGKKIAVAASITAVVAGLSYAAYFDYKRRNDRQFRRKLKRDRKKAEKTAEKTVDSDPSAEDVKELALKLLESVAAEKLPDSPEEKEKFFLAQVSKGEVLINQGPAAFPEAACRFYQAMKLYPNPVELVMIYQKTTPEPVFNLVMAMMAQEVRQKQGRYFDVFPPEDKNVRIKDKNKAKQDKAGEDEVVVPKRALFATKAFAAGDTIYEEDSVVSTLLPCTRTGRFCFHCMKEIPDAESTEAEEKAEETDETEKPEDTEETEKAEEAEKPKETEEAEKPEEKKEDGELSEDEQEPTFTDKSSGALECEKCHAAVYCTEKCRQDAYDAYHQVLCTGGANSKAREFAELTQQAHELAPVLIAKFFGILVDREKKKELARQLGAGEDKSELDQYTTWEHIEYMRYLEMVPTASDAKMLIKLGELMSDSVPGLTEFVSGDRYTMLKGKLDYNAYAVHAAAGAAIPKDTEATHVSDTMRDDHHARAKGLSLYLVSSHIAHHCDPNVQVVFPDHTSKAALKAIRPVAADEELHVSFVDPALDVEARKKLLESSYRITCTCSKCEADLAAVKAAEAEKPADEVKATEAEKPAEEVKAAEDKPAEDKPAEEVKAVEEKPAEDKESGDEPAEKVKATEGEKPVEDKPTEEAAPAQADPQATE